MTTEPRFLNTMVFDSPYDGDERRPCCIARDAIRHFRPATVGVDRTDIWVRDSRQPLQVLLSFEEVRAWVQGVDSPIIPSMHGHSERIVASLRHGGQLRLRKWGNGCVTLDAVFGGEISYSEDFDRLARAAKLLKESP